MPEQWGPVLTPHKDLTAISRCHPLYDEDAARHCQGVLGGRRENARRSAMCCGRRARLHSRDVVRLRQAGCEIVMDVWQALHDAYPACAVRIGPSAKFEPTPMGGDARMRDSLGILSGLHPTERLYVGGLSG